LRLKLLTLRTVVCDCFGFHLVLFAAERFTALKSPLFRT